MKSITSLLFTILICSTALAQQVLTVSNNPAIPAQYDNWVDAIAAANDGDVLYFHRSATLYTNSTTSGATLDKRLVLVAEGYNTGKENGRDLQPTVDYIRLRASASGSAIIGFFIDNRIQAEEDNVNNILIRDNRLEEYINLNDKVINNWVVDRNVFESPSSGLDRPFHKGKNADNIFITNNIFGAHATFFQMNNGTVVIDHNVFVGGEDPVNWTKVFDDCNGATITNNIFYHRTLNGITNGTWKNNIIYECDNSLDASNTFENTIGQDPLFRDYPATSTGNFGVVPMFDFRVDPNNSPALNAGTDPTDHIGLSKDVVPYNPPFLPYVTKVGIKNKVVTGNDQLQIEVEVQYPGSN